MTESSVSRTAHPPLKPFLKTPEVRVFTKVFSEKKHYWPIKTCYILVSWGHVYSLLTFNFLFKKQSIKSNTFKRIKLKTSVSRWSELVFRIGPCTRGPTLNEVERSEASGVEPGLKPLVSPLVARTHHHKAHSLHTNRVVYASVLLSGISSSKN